MSCQINPQGMKFYVPKPLSVQIHKEHVHHRPPITLIGINLHVLNLKLYVPHFIVTASHADGVSPTIDSLLQVSYS